MMRCLVVGFAVLAAAACVTCLAQLSNSENESQCVSRDELDKIKDEIDSMRKELDDWQNETLFILKKYLLQNSDSLTTKIEELHENEIGALHEATIELQAIGTQGQEIADSVDSLKMDIQTLNTSLSQLAILNRRNSSAPGTYENPIRSCKHLSRNDPSGYYWLQAEGCTETMEVYCDISRHCCGTTGGWMRIAHIDMTDLTQQCPPGLRLITGPRRTCGGNHPSGGCTSVTFPVHDYQYQKVCGKVIGYQYNRVEAFSINLPTIDDYYLDGVSITHSRQPRKHIWSFAAAAGELYTNNWVCPCTNSDNTAQVPTFVGTDYFCETASYGNIDSINANDPGVMFTQDPLWDGNGCGSSSTCCQFNNPPWFCKQLPASTTDDIELRICCNHGSRFEDTPLELVEIYVQ